MDTRLSFFPLPRACEQGYLISSNAFLSSAPTNIYLLAYQPKQSSSLWGALGVCKCSVLKKLVHLTFKEFPLCCMRLQLPSMASHYFQLTRLTRMVSMLSHLAISYCESFHLPCRFLHQHPIQKVLELVEEDLWCLWKSRIL